MTQERVRGALRATVWVFAAAALLSGAITTGIARGATSSTLFGAATPAVASDPDTGKVELGVRFKPAVNGQVTGVRFYKGVKNTGTHIGSLWSGGSRLATVTFRNETTSGWQAGNFDKPVGVREGQIYTASYVAPVGHYSVDNPYSFPKVSTNLSALGGVYKYGGGYPTDAYQKSNYWVDVMFSATVLTSANPTMTTSAPSAPTGTSAIVTPASSASSSATSSSTPRQTIGFPDSSNTGVPAGTVLNTVRNGDSGAGWHVERDTFYVDRAGTVIDGLRIPFVLKVMADDVVVRNSAVVAASYYTVNVSDPPRYYSRLTIVDSDIDGGSNAASQSIAVMAAAGSIFLRDNFHGFASSGPRLASGSRLQDSWIHDFVCQTPDHSAGTTANDGGQNIRIIHNNIDINTGAAGCASTAIGIDQDFGKYDDVVIQGNLVNGGAYCIYTAQKVPNNSYGQSTNIRVEGNTFGRRYYPRCGQYGAAAQVAPGNGNTFTGNVWEDGSPVTG